MQRLRTHAPRSVLIVCLGNICRSPFAAAVLEQRAAGRALRVESAGFLEDGRPTPAAALNSALRRGIDLSAHRSVRVTDALVQSADLVIVMDRAQRRALQERFERSDGVLVLGDLDPEPIDTRTIRDPFDQAEEIFDQVYDRIERCVHTLTLCL
ncbi:MAG: ATP-grasp domain-containing protein, partial [Longimicrobiales bacterium]